jgi:hypothetical protein
MSRKSVILVLGVSAVATAGFVWFDRPEGDAQTDRTARIVAEAVSWPRQESAAGFLNAVLNTTAARSGGLSVVEAADLNAKQLADPLARLTFHIHQDGSETAGWLGAAVEPMDACYRVEFSYYGAYESPPVRITCPPDLTPLEPRPQAASNGRSPVIKGAPGAPAP